MLSQTAHFTQTTSKHTFFRQPIKHIKTTNIPKGECKMLLSISSFKALRTLSHLPFLFTSVLLFYLYVTANKFWNINYLLFSVPVLFQHWMHQLQRFNDRNVFKFQNSCIYIRKPTIALHSQKWYMCTVVLQSALIIAK